MSTRYVWKQYSYKITEALSGKHTNMRFPLSLSENDTVNKNRYLILCASYELKYNENGVLNYYPVGSWKFLQITGSSKYIYENSTNYPYVIWTGPDSYRYGSLLLVSKAPSSSYPYWYVIQNTNDKSLVYLYNANLFEAEVSENDNGGVDLIGPKLEFESKDAKYANISKTYKGYVSKSTRDFYPDNDIYGSHYYEYAGSDNIDPTRISYKTENLEAGQQITISLSPSSSNQYGGTISYLYQYSRNNGNWKNLKTTMETSASYTIPGGTTNIQFRARASDDMGFISTDYAIGINAEVSQMRAYVGISGKARKVSKMYIGVNGKARQVVKGYIGVNGKARKFL